MKNLKGFTLAEILITLVIIGILASIMLPALKKASPNREQIMLKKAYYILGRNVNELINDEEFYPDRDTENLTGFSNVSIADQTADGREARYHGTEYSGNSKFCGLFAAKMNIRGNVNCDIEIGLDAGGNFQSADGIIWSMPVGDFNRGADNIPQTISVDVNGVGGQNCFEGGGCATPDRFRIFVDRFGRITTPPDGIEQIYLSRTNTNMSYSDLRKGYTHD